ncbi:PLP-dependent aminotransferase family protein [Flexivirga sp. ID2601S]|uniref:PLP-dependent aminotransferase family protein n=1 Tax=Flexivirga aerilata TaxID=1656889 RepID=A0A849AG39_9MICO|nr:PLP-dependent aminotransferase family protein [Flexivirga aerilata]NNG39435.1 PLP-dependent aminotransferase family protein [Flexivirga aerilata]
MPRNRRPDTLHLPTDAGASAEAVAEHVVRLIAAGRLSVGDPLPSTRAVALDSGIPRSRVVRAYELLGAGGYVTARAGSGVVVAAGREAARSVTASPGLRGARPSSARPADRRQARRPRLNLMPGAPDTSLIDERAWRQAWRESSRRVPDLDWYRPNEHEVLSHALRDHLRQVRGVVADAADIVIFPGVTAAITAVVDAVTPRRAAMEDPGYRWARKPLQDNVARLDLLDVDDDGLRVDRLRDAHQLVYVTPAHQYPLGGRMPVERRHDLLRWARTHHGVVIEDDFDGEFRHDAPPLGPLRAMSGAADQVVYVGTASKTLTPHLRLAWAVTPARLTDDVRRAAAERRADVCRITSGALAHFIQSGAMAKHLARTQRTYAARRQRLVAALTEQLPDLRITGADSGMHLTVRWAGGRDDVEVVERLRRRGVATAALSSYGVEHRPNGLLLGYAQLPETAAAGAVRDLAHALD